LCYMCILMQKLELILHDNLAVLAFLKDCLPASEHGGENSGKDGTEGK